MHEGDMFLNAQFEEVETMFIEVIQIALLP